MAEVNDLLPALEAILFVAEEPVPAQEIAEVLEVPVGTVEEALATLEAHLSERGSGLLVRRAGAGWRLYTRPDLHPYLERFATSATATRLSRAALETLAVVAYRQPVTRADVEAVRGVNSDSVLRTLINRGMIEEQGRLDKAGRPIVYGTTFEFLQHFGLAGVEQLPPMGEG